MSVLLRLLLSLTLLANLAGGAWALPAGAAGQGHAQATHRPAAMSGCHDGGQAIAATAHGDAAMHASRHTAAADQDCCRHAGCDCLQHCGAAPGLLPGTLVLASPHSREPATPAASLRGLPRPYQPVRPPIA